MDPKSCHLVTSVYILKMTLVVCVGEITQEGPR